MESQDHEDQMQLGLRIIMTASQTKMNSLEQEMRSLTMTTEEARANVSALSKKNSALEVEIVETHQRGQQLVDEHKELFKTVSNLQKQVDRLERLKQIMQKHREDDQAWEAELGDSRVLMSDEFLAGALPLTAANAGLGGGATAAGRPLAPPMAGGMAAPPREALALPAEPVAVSSSQMPPSASSPMMDGKEFFRRARGRLSYEAFNLFLASIKRLNNQQQTREDTLEEAQRIFGPELADLYEDFQNLLNRHGM